MKIFVKNSDSAVNITFGNSDSEKTIYCRCVPLDGSEMGDYVQYEVGTDGYFDVKAQNDVICVYEFAADKEDPNTEIIAVKKEPMKVKIKKKFCKKQWTVKFDYKLPGSISGEHLTINNGFHFFGDLKTESYVFAAKPNINSIIPDKYLKERYNLA